jgi:hypothetical protein
MFGLQRRHDKPRSDISTAPEAIRLAMMMYVRYSLLLRNVEDLLAEWGIDVTDETIGITGITVDCGDTSLEPRNLSRGRTQRRNGYRPFAHRSLARSGP